MTEADRGGIQGGTFGVMEGTIMMLGVLLGLSVTGDRFIIMLGIVTAGVADAFANAASFYVSEESEMIHSRKEIFKAAQFCFIGTIVAVAAIIIPLIYVPALQTGIIASLIAGLVVLILLGVYMSKRLESRMSAGTVLKYVIIGIFTALICFIIGGFMQYAAPFLNGNL